MTRAHRAFVALAFVALLCLSAGYAYGTTAYPRWHVTVRPLCMAGEDSAAHLRLRTYDRATHTAHYGCWHTGY